MPQANRGGLLWFIIFSWGLIAWAMGAEREAGGGRRFRMLFDDYYQRARPDDQFTQGVATKMGLQPLANFYSPEATAVPNGTFVLTRLIGEKFEVALSHQAISAALLKEVDAYMMICPVRKEKGGRAIFTDEAASAMEAFVARGGMLILIANSMLEKPEDNDIDLAGMNLLARRFGFEFLYKSTDILGLPVPRDHPIFEGVPNVIYGRGNILRLLPSADRRATVLLESGQASVPGPVGLIAPYKQGKVLAFGDGGSFGNAHLMRQDIGQARALQQMIYALLPEGPAPRYGWKEGLVMQVKVAQEQIMSGYPEELRLFNLPRPAGSRLIEEAPRAIDLASAPAGAKGAPPPAPAKDRSYFNSVISRQEGVFQLTIGAFDGRSHRAIWSDHQSEIKGKLLPTGKALDFSVPNGDRLAAWQWVLLHELICAPLKAYAQAGERWDAEALAALPSAQLSMTPHLVNARADYTFEGETSFQGKPCFLFTKTIALPGKGWSPQDLVNPEFAPQFNASEIKIIAGGEMAFGKFWVSRDSLLPVHTEVKVASALWWHDTRFPSRYSGTHNWMNYENWETANLVVSFGRTVTADFEVK